jgi:hypothetical protein
MHMQTDQLLRSLILTAHEILDPHHQGVCWPDPIAWDDRPLREIASDLCAVLDSEVEQATEIDDAGRIQKLRDLSDALWQAAQASERR